MEIITIHSYKGGAGKTTIALNLSVQLATTYNKKVLLIESDFKMPSFFGIFSNLRVNKYFNDFFNSEKQINLTECIQKLPNYNNLDIILANPDFNPEEKIHQWDKRYHAFHLKRLQNSFIALREKNVYDYVIFDTPPGLSYVAINNIALAHKAIVIVRPNSHAISGTYKMIQQLYQKTKNIPIYLLFNQIPRVKMTVELNEWKVMFEQLKVIETGRIPCSCDGTYQMAKGEHIFPKDHEINRYLEPMFNTLNNESIITIPDPTLDF